MSVRKTFGVIGSILAWPFESKEYVNKELRRYYSKRYKKWITVPLLFKCDGATWAPNVGWAWLFHDWMFYHGKFDDGTEIKWRQANRIMIDIMLAESQPTWAINLFRKGIKSKWSLKAWQKKRGR